MRTQIEIDQREIDAGQDAIDLGMVDEYGDLNEAGRRYVASAVAAYIDGES